MKKELHIISTGKQSTDELTRIAAEIHPYIDALHLREKQLGALQLFQLVKKLEANGVPLAKIYINDRVDVATVTGVQGVQLGFKSLDVAVVKEHFPLLRVGCSVHSLQEAFDQQQRGADFLIYGHIYETASKPELPPRGLDGLRELTAAISTPIIAIGGIDASKITEVLQANVQGVAVMSAVLQSENPLMAVQEMNRLLKV